MIQNPRAFFTQEDKLCIDKAVAEAEKKTSGEIVPVLAGRAAAYTHGLYHAALTMAALASLAMLGVRLALEPFMGWDLWHMPVWVVFPVQLAAASFGYHLARVRWEVHRAFLPRALMQARVMHAARRAFRDLGISNTKGATGIMLYVSLFERMAVVLADKGIAAKCPPETWDGVRDILIAGLKQGDHAKGYTDAIAECGRILAPHFPIQADDTNELPNELRVLA